MHTGSYFEPLAVQELSTALQRKQDCIVNPFLSVLSSAHQVSNVAVGVNGKPCKVSLDASKFYHWPIATLPSQCSFSTVNTFARLSPFLVFLLIRSAHDSA